MIHMLLIILWHVSIIYHTQGWTVKDGMGGGAWFLPYPMNSTDSPPLLFLSWTLRAGVWLGVAKTFRSATQLLPEHQTLPNKHQDTSTVHFQTALSITMFLSKVRFGAHLSFSGRENGGLHVPKSPAGIYVPPLPYFYPKALITTVPLAWSPGQRQGFLLHTLCSPPCRSLAQFVSPHVQNRKEARATPKHQTTT